MKIPIVNEQDEVIGYKDRSERRLEDIFRITGIWVFNKNKDFLIAKRSSKKKVSPNKWGPSAAGTVEEGDTYESNAIKEIGEELGLKNFPLKPFKKIYYENKNGKRFCFIFVAFVDKPEGEFALQKEEVIEVRWVSFDKLYSWYKKSPNDFIPSIPVTIDALKEYLDENKN